jgi:hypothetical protein
MIALFVLIVCYLFNNANGIDITVFKVALYNILVLFLLCFLASRQVLSVLAAMSALLSAALSGIALSGLIISLIKGNPGVSNDSLVTLVCFFLSFFHLFGVGILTIPEFIDTVNRTKE